MNSGTNRQQHAFAYKLVNLPTTAVIEYLLKKGYNRTEQTLREESKTIDKDSKPIPPRPSGAGPAATTNGAGAAGPAGPSNGVGGVSKYGQGFKLLKSWVETSLDIYKYELRRILWPVFIYSFLEMVLQGYPQDASNYLRAFGSDFDNIHHDVLQTLETIRSPAHVMENETAKLYRGTKYRIPLNSTAYANLITHLESNPEQGNTILYLLSTYYQYSFEAIINQAHSNVEEADLLEGIPGAFTGVSNKDMMDNNTVLKLGAMAMENDLAQDVRAALEDEDARNPPVLGQSSLVEDFDLNIKREDSVDGPSRNDIPLPPSRARDVIMEVQKIKEHRDRFKIEGRTGGVGPAVSVCIFTFHNTLDTITSIEFSDDNNMVAVGTEESYIRVWNLHGEPLPSINNTKDAAPVSSRRLIGHSAPVYSVSFSPSIEGPDGADEKSIPSTAPRLLLSSSSDKTVRLWSLEAWTCLIVYKGHDGPVWNVRWGPFGHYFATCGWDKTVRAWAQDHISYLRMMVGHDTNVNQVVWHPNGAYIFSASDNADKTVRMWSLTTGECVRVFSGHTDTISALECSPSGKILASADNGGSIILWDLAKGTAIKRCRGHGKGGIWSLSFSVESTVLASGGADGTVRLWDVEASADGVKNTDGEVIGTGGQADATRLTGTAAAAQPATAGVGAHKKKGKDTTITPDQLSAFPTKKSPVYKVKFTRMNLLLAGGCFLP
ncbi:WD40-repeat-containing domain protein [Bisporella sp. PMI_857]|nr:WD40-repeat-containing domain protein [Bisporella sp. PMI_857]